MIDVRLSGGHRLYVNAYQYSQMYVGLLEGRPDDRVNRMIVERAMRQAERLWGRRKVHLLPPDDERTDSEHPNLPDCQYMVWLTCDEAMDGVSMGSELVVVFYSHMSEDTPIREILRFHLGDLDWEQIADNYDW